MVIVPSSQFPFVNKEIAAGNVGCPCGGVLARWGSARKRKIRGLRFPLVPPRGRCRDCKATHVVLPDSVLLRREDAGFVIIKALRAAANGFGTRKISKWLSRAESTVRGWVTAARSNSGVLVALLSFELSVIDPLAPTVHSGNSIAVIVDLLGRLLAALNRQNNTVKLAVWELFSLVAMGTGLAPVVKFRFATRTRV